MCQRKIQNTTETYVSNRLNILDIQDEITHWTTCN